MQTGCAEPCSYCIIPTTRGEPVSVPIDRVLQEVDRVAAAGFKEIALTGVHLGSYGRDLDPRSSLIELLRALDGAGTSCPASAFARALRRTDVPWRRAIATCSSESALSNRWIARRTSSTSSLVPTPSRRTFICPFNMRATDFSQPCDGLTTIEFYSDLVERIRTLIPHASIGSDIIVGFPGETDSDFECLADYLERSPLTHLHVFPYSDRPGTPAARCPTRCTVSIVRERANRAAIDFAEAVVAIPAIADWDGFPRADAGRWVGRGDRELPEAQNSARARSERVDRRAVLSEHSAVRA